jgi:hypothetical protein
VSRLCARFIDTACGPPSLVIANLKWVEAGPAIKGLKHGCCSTGYWTPEQLALRGTVKGHTLRVDRRSPAASKASPCRGASNASEAGSRLLGHARGDLDGDGRLEEVSVRANDDLPVRCRYQLVVRQSRRVRTRAVVAPIPDAAAQGYEPHLVGLAGVARGRGLEAIVDSNCCGAYVTGQWVFRERRNGLRLMRVRPDTTGVSNAFGNGASVCCGETPVCGRNLGVVLEFGEGQYARPVDDAFVFVQRGDAFIQIGRKRLRRPGKLEDFANCRPWIRARK